MPIGRARTSTYLNGTVYACETSPSCLAARALSERTYTMIGQGLIDQALSQRAEERRRLFEEAVGITLYQSKRDLASQTWRRR